MLWSSHEELCLAHLERGAEVLLLPGSLPCPCSPRSGASWALRAAQSRCVQQKCGSVLDFGFILHSLLWDTWQMYLSLLKDAPLLAKEAFSLHPGWF